MTYATIESRLTNWMEDDDTEFTGSIDEIIALAEARVVKELGTDAVRELVTGNFTANNNLLARSSAVLGAVWFAVTVSSQDYFLEFRQDSFIRDRYPLGTATTGTPRIYGIHDEANWIVGPTPASTLDYKMMTEQRVTGLTSSQETWLSTRHGDVLFYAACLESGAFQKDSDEEKRYMAMYERALATAKAEVERGRTDRNNLSG